MTDIETEHYRPGHRFLLSLMSLILDQKKFCTLRTSHLPVIIHKIQHFQIHAANVNLIKKKKAMIVPDRLNTFLFSRAGWNRKARIYGALEVEWAVSEVRSNFHVTAERSCTTTLVQTSVKGVKSRSAVSQVYWTRIRGESMIGDRGAPRMT